MASFILRKLIRKLPGQVIKAIPLPEPIILEGPGTRAKLGEICREQGFNSVLIVTDKTLFAFGYHQSVVYSLKQNNLKVNVFSNIATEPNYEIVEEGYKVAIKHEADVIIALGGGAVMDSCKMIAAATKIKNFNIAKLQHKFLYIRNKTLPIIAIPSTAGTGAEITVGAMIINSKKQNKTSTAIIGLKVIEVILDSELTLHLPTGLTCACGIDALSHGLEGFVAAVKSSKEDNQKSKECVKYVFDNLPLLIETPTNELARQQMCRAALYGGNAINKQLAGYVHAVAHAIGAKYQIPHGNAIALSLLPVMEAQKHTILKPLGELALFCGFADENDSNEVAANRFLSALNSLIKKCKLPNYARLINPSDYPELIKMITNDVINYSPPIVFTKQELIAILEQISQ